MDILSALMTNKEWIFSGIGVLIIAGLSKLFWKIVIARKPHVGESGGNSNQANINEGSATVTGNIVVTQGDVHVYAPSADNKKRTRARSARRSKTSGTAPKKPATSIQFKEINESIAATPPFQQAQVAKNFDGIKVEWKMRLFSIHSPTNYEKRTRLSLNPDGFGSALVTVFVNIEDYPELKVAHAGVSVIVTGIIFKAERFGCELTDPILEVLK